VTLFFETKLLFRTLLKGLGSSSSIFSNTSKNQKTLKNIKTKTIQRNPMFLVKKYQLQATSLDQDIITSVVLSTDLHG